MKILAGIVFMSLSVGASAQMPDAAHVAALCKQVEHVSLPKLGAVSDAESRRLAKCDPAGLYYGVPRRPDYAAARRCAFFQRSVPDADDAEYAHEMAMGTLAMIYANGDGVPRNSNVATQFVCAASPEPEKDGARGRVIERLAELRTARAKRYDFCATVGGDFWKVVEMECGGIEVGLKDKRREARIVKLTSSWTEEQKFAFAALERVHAAFVVKSLDGEAEVCVTGSAMEGLAIRDQLRQQFVDDLENFEFGKLPNFSHEHAVSADRNLNVAYHKLIDGLAEQAKDGPCVKPVAMVRDAERAWIAYRDAWLRFSKVRWPEVSADSWLTFLTKERAARVAKMEF